MADHADEDEDLFEAPADEVDDEEQEGQPEGDDGDEPESEPEDETVIGFGDEDAGEDQDGLVPHLRAELREKAKRIRELEAGQSKPAPIEVGPKPTLADVDYDEEAYDAELLAWQGRKAKAEAQASKSEEGAQALQESFRGDVNRFATQKAALKVRDFDEAEETVGAALKPLQATVLLSAATNSAALLYALGKSPERLKALAAIQDPIKLAVAVANLERELKVTTTKRRAPEPDGPVRGSAPTSTSRDRAEERLEREAAKTGDRTQLIAYRRGKQKVSR